MRKSLVRGIVAPDATRSTPAAITTFLDAHLPAPPKASAANLPPASARSMLDETYRLLGESDPSLP